jgi:hypothetical protein
MPNACSASTTSLIISQAVIPAKAGIELKKLDSGSGPE